jgi:hypothetical protein
MEFTTTSTWYPKLVEFFYVAKEIQVGAATEVFV